MHCRVEDRVAFPLTADDERRPIPLMSDDDVQRRRTTGDDERRINLRCLVEDRDTRAPLQGASPTKTDTRSPLRGALPTVADNHAP